ncbi:MAG TPA: glycosyltransferase family 39 protein [Thermoanaerobaculia bacterium]|nr:glycosyltransferase family 39 protein [Thermoanaerobaculia bacterium]
MFESYVIHGSWSFLWKTLRQDAFHPPLDYAILKLVESLHPTDAARKIVPALWGVGTVAAYGVLLRRRSGRGPALLAMLLLAANPFLVRYSQELRPYSLGLFLEGLSLVLLDVALARRSRIAGAGFLLATLATAFTLYLAAVGLLTAAVALLADDCFSPDTLRRATARRFLAWSPVFGAVLGVAYLPWWSVVFRAAGTPYPARSDFSVSHFGRLIASFSITSREGGYSFGPPRLFYVVFAVFVLLVVAGFLSSAFRPGLRFLSGWLGGGFLLIQLLLSSATGRSGFRYYAGVAIVLPLLAAVGLATLAARQRGLAAGALLLILAYQSVTLADYYRTGRYDWRPAARFFQRAPDSEKIFADNQNSIFCLAYYLCGPRWLSGAPCRKTFVNLSGSVAPLQDSLGRGEKSWLVLSTLPTAEEPRRWSERFRTLSFPEAESITVRRIE